MWDTSNGRRWVVVAFWGVETTVTFCRDQKEAKSAYKKAAEEGADVFYAETKQVKIQGDS